MRPDTVLSNIENNRDNAFEMLKSIVNIDSYTHDKESVKNVQDQICNYLNELNISFERIENESYGDHIIATIKGTKEGKVLMMGHCDTVFPSGTVSERPYSEDAEYAYGPGVSDMKSGVVSMIFVASAIQEANIDFFDIELLITPDEEYGSPVSKPIIEERAKDATAVFNLEAGRPDGRVVTSRRGSAHFQFIIEGKASHSGVDYDGGVSAIEELAYKVIELKKLNNTEKGVNVNVGLVKAGKNTNMVAPFAEGSIHVSYMTNKIFKELKDEMHTIFNTSYISGTKGYLTGGKGILPMERIDGVSNLYNIVKDEAEKLNIDLDEKDERGAADAGFVASIGVPVICAMGPVGGNWHRDTEYMVKKSFMPRMKLLAKSVLNIDQIK